MGLSRKMLAAMDIPAEKIDEIITAHTETVNAIKEERDNLKTQLDELGSVEKDLEKANKKLEEYESGDWENKYNTLKGEYDTYKTDTEAKATKTAKESAYKQLLIDAGISDKRIASIMKVSGATIDELKLDKDGKIENVEKLTESAKEEWADFIVTTQKKGADVTDPPANDGDGGQKPSRAAQLAAQYRNEHYGNPKED